MTTRQQIDRLFEIGPPDELNVSRDQAVADWQAALHSGKSSKELEKDFELYGKRLAANYNRGKGSDYKSARVLAAAGKLKEARLYKTPWKEWTDIPPVSRLAFKAQEREREQSPEMRGFRDAVKDLNKTWDKNADVRKSFAAWRAKKKPVAETLTGYGSGGNVGGSTSGTGGMEVDAGSEVAHMLADKKVRRKRRVFEIALPLRAEQLSPEEQGALIGNNATNEQVEAYLRLKEEYAEVGVPYAYSSAIAMAKGAPCVLACWCHYKDGGKIFIAITKDGETHS